MEMQATGESASAPQVPIYFAVSTLKLVSLSLCTFGLYELYWFYKNWQLERGRTDKHIRPFWRTFFVIFWCYSLFRGIVATNTSTGISRGGGAGLLATLYILSSISWKLPDPYWLVSFASVVPLLVAPKMVDQINARMAPSAARNGRFSGLNVAALVVGGPLLILVVVTSFFPEFGE